jgi:hypothetical protein
MVSLAKPRCPNVGDPLISRRVTASAPCARSRVRDADGPASGQDGFPASMRFGDQTYTLSNGS